MAEHCIHAQLLEARRDPGWSGLSWAGIWGPRGDPVSGPPPYICSLRWAVWTAVWAYQTSGLTSVSTFARTAAVLTGS